MRLDGIPALDLWSLLVLVLGNTNQTPERPGRPVVCRDKNHVRHQPRGVINVLDNVDLVPSNVRFSHQQVLLYVFEDNEAVIEMIIKGRSPTMRHVSRTHRVALDWLFDRINLDTKNPNQIHRDAKNQLADMLTKGNFTRDVWNNLLCLFNISHFSSAECSEVMSKRTQNNSGEERVTAKSKPMMNLVARCSERASAALSSTTSESPWKTRYESHSLLRSWSDQHLRTGRPVKDAYSSNYSEWNGMGTAVGLVQRFISIQNFRHDWQRTDGIRVEYFPGFTSLQALLQSPRVHV